MNRMKQGLVVVLVGILAGGVTMESALARQGGMGGGPMGGPGGGMDRHGGPRGGVEAVEVDADGDGVITREEFLAAAATRAESHFGHMDRDGDGLIASDELPPARGDRFALSEEDQATLDACLEEALGSALETPPTPEERFAASDTNGDGYVDLDEFTAEEVVRATERFAQIDTDGDGALSEEEREAGREAARTLHRARMECMMELRGDGALLLR